MRMKALAATIMFLFCLMAVQGCASKKGGKRATNSKKKTTTQQQTGGRQNQGSRQKNRQDSPSCKTAKMELEQCLADCLRGKEYDLCKTDPDCEDHKMKVTTFCN